MKETHKKIIIAIACIILSALLIYALYVYYVISTTYQVTFGFIPHS